MARIRSRSAGGAHGAPLPHPTADRREEDSTPSLVKGWARRMSTPSQHPPTTRGPLLGRGGRRSPLLRPIFNARQQSTLPPNGKGWSLTEVASIRDGTRDDAPVRRRRLEGLAPPGQNPPSDDVSVSLLRRPRLDGQRRGSPLLRPIFDSRQDAQVFRALPCCSSAKYRAQL